MRIGQQDAENLNQVACQAKGMPYVPRVTGLINTKHLNLNLAGDEVRAAIAKVLKERKVMEYRQVESVLNEELCERYLYFRLELDQLPELNWNDGSQIMTLKCAKHLPCNIPRIKKKKKSKKEKEKASVTSHQSVGLFENMDDNLSDKHSQQSKAEPQDDIEEVG